MKRRYGSAGTPAPAQPPTQAQQALAAGRVILTRDPDDGLWALRWTETPTAPRATLSAAHTGALDEAYRAARHLRDESDASSVNLTLDDQPEPQPVSATVASSTDPAPITEIALRSPRLELLACWAAERFGVTAWRTLDDGTRIGE